MVSPTPPLSQRPSPSREEGGNPRAALRGLLAALAAAVAVPVFAADPLPVAPPPREVRPDGSRDPAPAGAKAEDPAEVVNRIISNAKQVGDKLAMTDTGEGTRTTQAGILKDIDTLLDPPDSPPKGGGGDSNDKNNQDKNDGKGKDSKGDGKGDGKSDSKGDSKTGGMPGMKDGMGSTGGNDSKGGMDPGGMDPGGTGQKDGQANGRRPRQGSGGPPKDGKDPGGSASAAKGGEKQPMPMPPGGATAKANDPKAPPVAAGGNNSKTDRPPPPLSAQLPLAEEVAKEVWGHLPDGLRQQMSQYYREEFMPRYAGLLRQYYSSLANTPAGPSPAPRPPAAPR